MKAGRPKRRRAFKKRSKPNDLSRLVFLPKNNMHTPLPMRYYTKFVASSSAYTATGLGSGDYNWAIKLNSPIKPFANMSVGLTYNTINPATYMPTGLTSLFNTALYTFCIVSGVKIEIDVTPQSITDTCQLTLTPSVTVNVPTSLGIALGKPWTKQQNFSANKQYQLGDFPLRQFYSPHKFLGIPKLLYDNSESGNYTAAVTAGPNYVDPPGILYAVINLETGDNSILSQPMEIRTRVTYYCELRVLNTEGMLNT